MAKETIRNASVFRPVRHNGRKLVPVRRLEGKAKSRFGPTCPQDSGVGLSKRPWSHFAAGLRNAASVTLGKVWAGKSRPRSPKSIRADEGRPLMGPIAASVGAPCRRRCRHPGPAPASGRQPSARSRRSAPRGPRTGAGGQRARCARRASREPSRSATFICALARTISISLMSCVACRMVASVTFISSATSDPAVRHRCRRGRYPRRASGRSRSNRRGPGSPAPRARDGTSARRRGCGRTDGSRSSRGP